MCGRYASVRSADDLVAAFDVDELPDEETLPPNWNVAPTDRVRVVLERPARPATGDRPARPRPARQLRQVRWGLVPSWAEDVKVGARMINARVETVAAKPAFRTAVARRRCLVPADGYYEWYADAGRKRPHFLHRRDDDVLAFAGLYEMWRDPARGDDDPLRWVWSCTIITTAATDDLGHIHDRMPMIVPAVARTAWLDTARTDGAAACEVLVPAGAEGVVAYPVSNAVGDVRNNGPHLIEPAEPGAGTPDAGADDPDDLPTLF